jgi:hypothetical protein
MTLGIVIEDEVSRENWKLAEDDMRRFWSHRCKVHRYPDRIFIEVGAPVRIRVKMGIERLKSFCVNSRPAISWSFIGKKAVRNHSEKLGEPDRG